MTQYKRDSDWWRFGVMFIGLGVTWVLIVSAGLISAQLGHKPISGALIVATVITMFAVTDFLINWLNIAPPKYFQEGEDE